MNDDFIDVDLIWENCWLEREPYIPNDEDENYDPEDDAVNGLFEYLLKNQPW